MKQFLSFAFLLMLLAACGSSKNYLERSDEDKALADAVRKINRTASDDDAKEAIPILYKNIVKVHTARVKSIENGSDLARWDKIINEYSDLQNAYDLIINSSAAFKLVTPENFGSQLLEARQSAAAAYYAAGQNFLEKQGRQNAKTAYNYFKKSGKYVNGFKDVQAKMDVAFNNAIVDVVINAVQDDRYFYNSGWGSSYDYSNDYFQRSLVRDLSYNNNNSNYAARFYSDWQAQRENINPDWTVDLRLRNIDLPQPYQNTYRQTRSADVQTGTDTSGKPIYTKVYATVNITRMSFTARADMEVFIRDLESNKIISNRSFRDDYRWQEERGSYTGDSRALNSQDWAIVNNRGNMYTPRRDEVLAELYRKLYPQVLNNIKYAVDW